ncbi:GACJJ protein, partial [Nothoprocta pentlandii]|nr:GACJJ protein [Nothoprocta pentlandii]
AHNCFFLQKSFSSIRVKQTTNKVTPDLQRQKGKSAFGVPLETLIQEEPQCRVPFLVTQMVEYLEVFGLEHVGIFRINGSVHKIKELKQKYNQGEDVDLINDGDVNTVARLFMYVYYCFTEHEVNTTECLKNLRQLLSCLPKAHHSLLQFLAAFLLKVSAHSAVNFMTLENLAIVFGPAFFK